MGRGLLVFVLTCLLLSSHAWPDEKPSSPKPVPRMQVIPLPHSEASIQDDGRELTRLIYDNSLRRPFLYPLMGPSGRSLTRMGHPRDPNSHSHHNSVWISHHMVNGVDFWGDAGKGRIVQRHVTQFEDADDEALIQTENDWLNEGDKVLLKEFRSIRLHPLADKQYLLVIDLELAPPEGEVTIGKTPFGFIGVRMAKTIGVHDGGGEIRNSAGGVNERDVFWKPAQWVDYSGPIAKGAVEGITLMDHPSNPDHPATFHVRDDGWMGASATFHADHAIRAGIPLKLRYGLWIHGGFPTRAAIDQQFASFAQIGDPPANPAKK